MRDRTKAIAGAFDLAQGPARDEHHVGIANPIQESGVGGNAESPDVVAVVARDEILPAERDRHR